MKKSILVLSIAAVFVFASLSAVVFAQEETASPSPTHKPLRPGLIKDRIQAAHDRNLDIRENIKNRASEAAQKRHQKLSEARLKVCQARARNIGSHFKNMNQRALQIHNGHGKIYMRVDKFYTDKLVPNGYTLSNYADLKAEVEANKANVIALHDALKATGVEFDCNSEDPMGQVDAFKEDMRELIEANKEYRESIHNFVKAVRDLAKTAKEDKMSASPSAEVTE